MPRFVNTLLKIAGVLAILFIIALVLFPIFAKVRERSGPSCASNEKQIGLALIQYVQDNDECMPNTENGSASNSWRTAIFPYLKSSGEFQCPDRDPNDHTANPIGADGYAPNYAANDDTHGAFAGPGAKPVSVAYVTEPKRLIVLVETSFNSSPGYDIDDAANFSPASHRLWAGHTGGSEYLMFDSHVKYFKPSGTYQVVNGHVFQNLWYRNGNRPLSANGVAVLQDAQKRFAP